MASLARASEAFVSSSRAVEGALLLEQLGQAGARLVEVAGELPELVAVRHVDPLAEVAGGDPGERVAHLADRQDERPRQREAEKERHGDAHHGERHDRGREQGPIGLEGGLCLVDLLVGGVDQAVERRLQDVRVRMFLVEVELARGRQVAGDIQGDDPLACGGIGTVRGSQVLEDLGVARIVAGHRVQQPGEDRLLVKDLGVVLRVVGQEGHRPVVALGGDRVEHLLGPARLDLEVVDVLDARVHPPDHDEAEDGQRHEEEGPDEEARQELDVDARPDPGDDVDERAEPAREPRQARFGRSGDGTFWAHVQSESARSPGPGQGSTCRHLRGHPGA